MFEDEHFDVDSVDEFHVHKGDLGDSMDFDNHATNDNIRRHNDFTLKNTAAASGSVSQKNKRKREVSALN